MSGPNRQAVIQVPRIPVGMFALSSAQVRVPEVARVRFVRISVSQGWVDGLACQPGLKGYGRPLARLSYRSSSAILGSLDEAPTVSEKTAWSSRPSSSHNDKAVGGDVLESTRNSDQSSQLLLAKPSSSSTCVWRSRLEPGIQ